MSETLPPIFEPTPPRGSSLGPFVRTAACLIIGDEVLNGKTQDTNSNRMAKFCFELGIELKRVEIIPDDENEIVEAARRLSSRYDWVVTSGGIGPTPDDITYQSIARAFGDAPLAYHDEALRRMDEGIRSRYKDLQVSEEARIAQKRMVLLPTNAEVIFPTAEYWVPVVRMNGNLCVLPGVPRIFEALLHALPSYMALDPATPKPIRSLVQTSLPESLLSPLLTRLTKAGKKEGIRVGSYPKWLTGVHISIIGYDRALVDKYVAEVIHETNGHLVT